MYQHRTFPTLLAAANPVDFSEIDYTLSLSLLITKFSSPTLSYPILSCFALFYFLIQGFHSAALAGLELRDAPASGSRVLGLKVAP